MERVLVIEDCSDLQALIRSELEHRFQISAALTLSAARQQIKETQFDAVLLDVGLPDGNGFEFCRWLRNRSDTQDLPVVFLTAKAEPAEKVMGFALGADDYVVKPFDSSELRARIQARLKGRRQAAGEQLARGPFRFNRILQRAAVLTPDGERDLRLTPFEFRVFYFLASREPEIFSRSALLKGVIDGTLHVNEDTIYTHISALRRKLGAHAAHLECIARVGYRFLSAASFPGKPSP